MVVRITIIASASVLVAGAVFLPMIACFLAHLYPGSGRDSEYLEKMTPVTRKTIDDPEELDAVSEGNLNDGFIKDETDSTHCSDSNEVEGHLISSLAEVEETKGDGEEIELNEGDIGEETNGCEETIMGVNQPTFATIRS